MKTYAIISSTNAAAIWYRYTSSSVAPLTHSTTTATPPMESGMSTAKERNVTSICRPWPLNTPPVHSELSTPRMVATKAAGNTFAAFLTTVPSEVVNPTVSDVNGNTHAATHASTPNTSAVLTQKESLAAAPSPLPRWYPTLTAMTIENMALTAPAHTTVAVLTAVVAATASVPSLLTSSVVAWPTTAPNTRVPTRGRPCLRNSSVLARVCSDDFQPGQKSACSFRHTNMYSQYARGWRHRLKLSEIAAPMNPKPRQPSTHLSGSRQSHPHTLAWRRGPPKTKNQLSSALTKRKKTELYIAGRGLPTAWK
mmetsp:Transcript_6958/g.27325  ORF Transcript_6958/g.27325 Transcript_6958/m.27325 type:complete len:310 (-) Transcript_6958:695-1624(-)